MKKVTVVYQTTLFYEQKVEVPDDFDIDNEEHFQDVLDKLSFTDETDMYTEVNDIIEEE
jgi:hypothetical protein